jgi:hypothetical protein
MTGITKVSVLAALLIGVAIGATVVGTNLLSQPAAAQGEAGAAKGNHTVVGTDGTHLIVTDNKTDTLYFYSIEKDAAIGSDLKLRGKLDLTQVGKDVLSPVVMFKKEK